MKRIVGAILVAGVMATSSSLFADQLRDFINNTEKTYYKGTNGKSLPYRLVQPKIKEGVKYPLVIFLHGAGERGDDNVAQFNHACAMRLVYDCAVNGQWSQSYHRQAFILFPQCAKNSQWALVPWGEEKSRAHTPEPSPDLKNVHELVQKLKVDFPIDDKRIYVTGLSMGGYGTWDYVVRWPNEVAGAIVVCGGADDAGIAADPVASQVPVRIFHGTNDTAVPVVRGRSAFDAVKAKNRNAIYTEYGAEGHGIWNRAYSEPGLGGWLFYHRKK